MPPHAAAFPSALTHCARSALNCSRIERSEASTDARFACNIELDEALSEGSPVYGTHDEPVHLGVAESLTVVATVFTCTVTEALAN